METSASHLVWENPPNPGGLGWDPSTEVSQSVGDSHIVNQALKMLLVSVHSVYIQE